MAFAIGRDILHVEAAGQVEVELNSRALGQPTHGIPELDVDLGTVEDGLALRPVIVESPAFDGVEEGALGDVPVLIRPHILAVVAFLPDAEVHLEILVVEGAHEKEGEVERLLHLLADLLASADDMGIVLGESPDSDKAVQHARPFVAIHGAKLEVADRQLPVAPHLALVDEDVEGAVHRLNAVLVLVDLHARVHAVRVEAQVAAGLPQVGAGDVRREDEVVAALQVLLPPELLDQIADERALWVPEDEAPAELLGDGEEVELAPEAAVIAARGFLAQSQKLVELLLRREGRPVYALEHRVALVPAPVSACGVEELIGPEAPCRGEMRPPAEVDEVALGIDAHRAFGYVFEQLDFVLLAPLAEELDSLLSGHLLALEREIRGDDLGHGGLDLRQVLGSERGGAVEVVVETLFDGGADGELGVRIELLNRLRHHVRGRVADHLAASLILEGEDLDALALGEGSRQVELPSIGARGEGLFRQGGIGATEPFEYALRASVVRFHVKRACHAYTSA